MKAKHEIVRSNKMKKNYDLIFIAGAPGTGKTTTARLLQEKLKSPRVEFSWIRGYHLNKTWSNHSKKEEEMSFENIIFILRNYLKNGYSEVIVNDFEDFRIQQIPKLFKNKSFIIFTLLILDDKVLKRRVLTETRDSGFRDFEKAIEWNRELQKRPLLKNEYRINNASTSPSKIVSIILRLLKE